MARSPRAVVDEPTRIDRLFGAATTASGLLVLVLLALVGYFLFLRAGDAFDVAGWSFFTTEEWRTDVDPPEIGVLGLVCGTVVVAIIAVVIAVPLGTCAALFITDYATGRWRSLLTGLVDLLAAIPSLLYGVWGFFVLQDQIVPLSEWLAGRLAGELDAHLVGPEGLARRGLFRAGVVEGLLAEHRRGGRNNAGRLWALLILERWFRRWAPAWTLAA